jgi:hypothetical protein
MSFSVNQNNLEELSLLRKIGLSSQAGGLIIGNYQLYSGNGDLIFADSDGTPTFVLFKSGITENYGNTPTGTNTPTALRVTQFNPTGTAQLGLYAASGAVINQTGQNTEIINFGTGSLSVQAPQGLVVPNLNASPTGTAGAIYYDAPTGKFKGYNGVSNAWQDLN